MRDNTSNKTIDQYIDKQLIGKGGFAYVYRCRVKGSNEWVAMKSIKMDMQNQGFPSAILREISALRQVKHQNIITLKQIFKEKDRIYLIFEYIKRDLKDYIDELNNNQFIDDKTIKKIMRGLLSGIAACHSKKVMHRDIKTSNILIDDQGNVKIADFGLARTTTLSNPPYSEQTSTLWYRAPEILLGSFQYSKQVDIWSLGCVFAEIVLKRVTFKGKDQIDQLDQIFRVFGTPTERTWLGFTKLLKYNSSFPTYEPQDLKSLVNDRLDQKGLDLLKSMLRYDPDARITAQEALLHPYFASTSQ